MQWKKIIEDLFLKLIKERTDGKMRKSTTTTIKTTILMIIDCEKEA